MQTCSELFKAQYLCAAQKTMCFLAAWRLTSLASLMQSYKSRVLLAFVVVSCEITMEVQHENGSDLS